jgi:hypothetical protein
MFMMVAAVSCALILLTMTMTTEMCLLTDSSKLEAPPPSTPDLDGAVASSFLPRMEHSQGAGASSGDPAGWQASGLTVYPERQNPVHREDCTPSFTKSIRKRLNNWKSEGYTRDSGLWQRVVNDKLAQTKYSQSLDVRTPQVLFCDAVGDPSRLKFFLPPKGMGFVVKDLDGSSSKGVYVLVDGWGGVELLSGNRMGADDVIAALQLVSKASKGKKEVGVRILVEEYIASDVVGRINVDYKFYMYGGKVGAINAFYNRGTDAKCKIWLDEDWNRVDEFGCFGSRDTTSERERERESDAAAGLARAREKS